MYMCSLSLHYAFKEFMSCTYTYYSYIPNTCNLCTFHMEMSERTKALDRTWYYEEGSQD